MQKSGVSRKLVVVLLVIAIVIVAVMLGIILYSYLSPEEIAPQNIYSNNSDRVNNADLPVLNNTPNYVNGSSKNTSTTTKPSGGGGGGGDGEDGGSTCTDTCDSLGYSCGNRSICGVVVNCGECFTCSDDAGCSAVGSFCQSDMPYICSQGSDGCLDRVNGSECTDGKSCLSGICVSGCSSLPTGFADSFDNADCINLASAVNVVFSGGSISANGTAFGELEAEPTMQGLYHFNNDSRFLEDDIRLAYDFSGKGRNAWGYSVGLFSVDGKFGRAYDVMHDGTARAFLISEREINKDNWTFAFWIRFSENTSNVVGTWRFFGNGDIFTLTYSSNSLDLRFPNSQHLYTPKLNWTKDSWHHVAVSLQSGNNTIYIDGNLAANNTYSEGFNYTSDFHIGWWGGSLPANIAIDELSIWNRVLETDEIQAFAKGEKIRTGGLESNWINSGYFNSVKATLKGQETTKILFTCEGVKWEELQNGKWESYQHHYQIPCSKFKYKLEFSGGNVSTTADSITFEWRNETESESFTFMVIGDTHEYMTSGGVLHEEIANQMEKVDPDLVLHHGDFVSAGPGDIGHYQWRSFLRTTERLRARRTIGLETSYFASIGNHERNEPFDLNSSLDGYFDAFNYSPHRSQIPVDPNFEGSMIDPDDSSYYNNRYYSFKYKNACFVSLFMYDPDMLWYYHGTADVPENENYPHTSKKPIPDPTNLSRATAQYKWLYYTLKNCSEDSNIKWKFIYFHYPAFSSGGFNSDPAIEGWTTQFLRQHLVPLFEYFNVSIVFSGHEHDYERTYPIKEWYNETKNFNEGIVDSSGIVYIVDGNGGNGGDAGFNSSVFKSYTAYGINAIHSTKITVDGNSLYGATVLINGTWVDNFTMSLSGVGATTAANPEIVGSSAKEEQATLSFVSQIYKFFKGFLTANTVKEITGYFLKIR